jgi:hypothetical protein
MKKKLLISSVVLLAVVILFLIFSPIIIKNYAVNHSKELLGRQIHIDKLRLNYFTGTLRIMGFEMLEANERDVFVSFDTLLVDLEPYQLLADKKVMERFYLEGLHVNMIVQDSTFNFDDLVAFHNSPEDSVVTDSTDIKPYKYLLNNIEVKNTTIVYDDRDLDHVKTIEDFSFFIAFIGWDQKEKSNMDLAFDFGSEGHFESKILVNPVDGEYTAAINIQRLDLDPFYKNVAQYANINSITGQVNGDINISGNINSPGKAILSGVADVNDLVLTDRKDTKFLGAKKTHTALKEINYANSRYIIDSLIIEEPYGSFELDSLSNNFFRIFNYNPDEVSTDTTETSIYYALNHTKVQRGVLDYTDNLTGEPFHYHLSEIAMDSDSILSSSAWIDVYSQMLLNDRGTLKAKVGFNPANYYDAQFDFSVEDFLLSDLNIYSKHYVGHEILQGDMFYYSLSSLDNGKIESENRLVVRNVAVNNTKSGLFNLPLKFAIFLLKDKNGDIKLEVPVRGDLNNPTVNMGKIIWTTFKNIIFGSTESPAGLLAGLVDAKPKDLEALEFEFLDTIPSEDHLRKIDLLHQLEQKKKGLKIQLQYFEDPELEKEALAVNEAGKQYGAQTGKDYKKDEKGFLDFLKTQDNSDSLSVSEASRHLVDAVLLDSLAMHYTSSRIEAIKSAVGIGSDSTQIQVSRAEAKDPLNTGSRPLFKVKFSLFEDLGAQEAP